jgi:hypothetical protein
MMNAERRIMKWDPARYWKFDIRYSEFNKFTMMNLQ